MRAQADIGGPKIWIEGPETGVGVPGPGFGDPEWMLGLGLVLGDPILELEDPESRLGDPGPG